MRGIDIDARCASCVAFDCGSCLLSELPVQDESVCTDYRPEKDEQYVTRKSYGR